jgi:hypothetical protein
MPNHTQKCLVKSHSFTNWLSKRVVCFQGLVLLRELIKLTLLNFELYCLWFRFGVSDVTLQERMWPTWSAGTLHDGLVAMRVGRQGGRTVDVMFAGGRLNGSVRYASWLEVHVNELSRTWQWSGCNYKQSVPFVRRLAKKSSCLRTPPVCSTIPTICQWTLPCHTRV